MGIEVIHSFAGSWLGTSELVDPERNVPERSESLLTIAPMLGKRFVRLDYTWAHQARPQEGSMLLGQDGERATAHWIDTWHMGTKAMLCEGTLTDGSMTVRGSYAAPPGPDWGWRIDLAFADPLVIAMFNVAPDGTEYPAVTAEYRRG